MKERIKKELREFACLVKCVPTAVAVLFVTSVIAMNLLANKSIDLGVDWIALDCGIIVSWFAFLAMDIITKHFGPKAATEISVLAILVNLIFCLIMFIAGKIPGVWGESYVDGSETAINTALDRTFGGTWYVLLGSAVAFAASSAINNFTNYGIGKAFAKNPDGLFAFIMRSYVSTAIGQLADNLIFAFLVSRLFFGWTTLQCVTCALTGMAAELLFEAAFSYFGYAICKRWKRNGVGAEYIALVGATSGVGRENTEEVSK